MLNSYILQRADTVASGKDMGDALDMLLRCLDGTQIGRKGNNLPGVFIAFDEAQSLAAEPLDQSTNRTHFTELLRTLRVLEGTSTFSIFFSATSNVSQFAMPKDTRGFYSIEKTLRLPLPFSDLGFDQMMQNCKLFNKYKTIDDVTSTECVVHMGRPL